MAPDGPQTWILTGSPENFAATREHGFGVIGMKERRRLQALSMEPGDRIVFYLTKVGAFAGSVRLTGEMFEDRTPLWPGKPGSPDTYPWRFPCEPEIVLDEQDWVPASELRTELERSLRYGRRFVLALCDLDEFKQINDTDGHPAGDRALEAVAALLEGDPAVQVVGTDLRDGWSADLTDRHGRERVHELIVDVTDHDAVRRAVDDVAARIGTPTQLVNCAGIQYNCAALDLTIEGWRNLMAVNLDGSFSFCQAAGRHMVVVAAMLVEGDQEQRVCEVRPVLRR